MQSIVVAATMPSLLSLSRTRAYSALRIGVALFTGFAAAGWMIERPLDMHSSLDLAVDTLADHAVSIAA